MKAVLLLVLLGLALQVSAWNKEDELILSYNFACTKGFFQGFTRGFYNRPEYHIPDSCLGTGARKLVEKLWSAWESGEFLNIFYSFSQYYQLQYIFKEYCDVDEIFFDLSTFCLENTCSPSKIMQGLPAKIINLMGAINMIAEAFVEENNFPITDTPAYFEMYNNIGTGSGKILRVLLDYKKR